MRLAVEISVVVDGKRRLLGSIPIEFHLRDLRPRPRLSERQQEVVDLLVAGKSNKEIAVQLFIAERTVKYHISELMRRHGVSSRIALIAARQKHTRSGGQDT
jgi:DNA-binding NarL/FixJ family response regulator